MGEGPAQSMIALKIRRWGGAQLKAWWPYVKIRPAQSMMASKSMEPHSFPGVFKPSQLTHKKNIHNKQNN